MYDATNICIFIITTLATAVTLFLVPWLKKKVGVEKFEQLNEIYEMLVMAAEQMFKGEGKGQEKLDWVVGELMARGIKIDMALIEACVKRLCNTPDVVEISVDKGEIKDV